MKLVVRYADLPVTSTRLEVMVKVMEPIALIPTVLNLSGDALYEKLSTVEPRNKLKEGIIQWWESLPGVLENFPEKPEVELIECDLLTPIQSEETENGQ